MERGQGQAFRLSWQQVGLQMAIHLYHFRCREALEVTEKSLDRKDASAQRCSFFAGGERLRPCKDIAITYSWQGSYKMLQKIGIFIAGCVEPVEY